MGFSILGGILLIEMEIVIIILRFKIDLWVFIFNSCFYF